MSDARAARTAAASALRSAARSERALTIAGAAVVAVVLLVTLMLPYAQEKHRIATEVPQPYPLYETSLVELRPRQQGCEDQIGLLPGLQVAQMRIGTFGKRPAPLEFSLLAQGYREAVPVPANTYNDNGLLQVPFKGPPKPLEGSVCVANRGEVNVALYAAADITKSRSTTLVAGRPWPSNFDLAFYADRKESLIEAKGAILKRALLFHAHVGINLLRLLVLLFLLGLPLASLAALIAPSARRRDARDTRAPEAQGAASAP
jgi:hypothetical protein